MIKIPFNKAISILLVLFLTTSTCVLSQGQKLNYGVKRITTEIQKTTSGISQNTLRCIFQDHKGLLWLGTWDGLNRYDGIRFNIIRNEVGTPNEGLSNSTVNAIVQDKDNTLWVGTDGGINCISYRNFKRVKLHIKTKLRLYSDTIHALVIDKKQNIWIGSQNGLCILNEKRDSVILLSHFMNLSTELDSIEIRQIIQFQKNIIWVGTAKGLYKINLLKHRIIHFGKRQLSDLHITFLQNYKDSLLFIGTENGLNILNNKTKKVKAYFVFPEKKNDMGSNVFLSALLDNDSCLLIGFAGHGLYSFYFNGQPHFQAFKIPLIGSQEINYYNPQEEDITCMMKDDYGNLWLGTAWNGILCISHGPILFKTFRKTENKINSLNDNRIWCFYSNGDELWVGTDKGINIYNIKHHTMRYITRNNGLSSNKIRAIHRDNKLRYWIGTFNGGLNIIDTANHISHYMAKDKNILLPNSTIWNITEDTLGGMWLSTYSGLVYINGNTMQAKAFKHNPKDSTSLSSNTVFDANYDSKSRLWVSTYRGLNLFDPMTHNFQHFFHQEGNNNSLSTNKIFSVYDDKHGNLWISTLGGGLNKMDLNTGDIQWFTTRDGLSNNVIYSLIDDSTGYLWLSSNLGINRFNMLTHVVNTYGVNDGLQSSEFNFGAAYISPSHTIYMGGMKGFNSFNPQSINRNNKKPRLCISAFISQKGPRYTVNFGDTINLSPSDNSFTIDFTNLNINQSQKTIFRHRLENYDGKWINTKRTSAQASYANVPAGRYVFLVEAANKYGVWGSSPLKLTIVVKQYWYKSLAFILGIASILLLLLVLAIRQRIKRIEYKSEIEKQIHQLERQSLRLQMNPHFVFNTLNSIQSFILNNEAKESISYLSKFSKLMRSILNNSTESIISLQDEIDMLKYYLSLEQLRFGHAFDYTFHIDKNIDTEYIGIPGMLLQIYIENAIIHGVAPLSNRKGHISISFELIHTQLKCIIEDNGVGRNFHKNNKDTIHKAKGMSITKKRLELLNKTQERNSSLTIKDLFDDQGKACGTRIIIWINFTDL